MNLSNITIPNFHNVDYPFTINGISRRGAMGLTFGDIELKNVNFIIVKIYFLEDVDINKIHISSMVSLSKKNINL